jgi:mevalonate kinase
VTGRGRRTQPRIDTLILLIVDRENAKHNLPTADYILEFMQKEWGIGSHAQVYRVIHMLVENKILQKVGSGLQRYKAEIEESLLTKMEGYDIVAYAPFAPVIAGAHAVLSGHPCLILPLNAYVGIGLRKIKETGGEVICRNLPQSRYGQGELTETTIQNVANFAMRVINEPTGRSLVSRPSYEMQLVSDIDATLGCGGSGAVAVAGSLCFMSAFGLLHKTAPFAEYKSNDQLSLFMNAFRIENYIHAGFSDEKGFFSSGASIFGSIVGSSEARLYEYWITPNGLEDSRNHTRRWPEYERELICMNLPSDRIFLVLGGVKWTQSCIRQVRTLREIIGGDIVDSLFEIWGKVVDRLAQEFKRYEVEGKLKSESISALFSIQHSLYISLGLGNKTFTHLLLSSSDKEILSGSIIGAGKGGTCLFFAPEMSTNNLSSQLDRACTSEEHLERLPSDEFLKASAQAKILKPV